MTSSGIIEDYFFNIHIKDWIVRERQHNIIKEVEIIRRWYLIISLHDIMHRRYL